MTVAGNRIAFGLLGPLLVTDGSGPPIRVPAAKQRIILAALLLSANVAVPAERLADAVWGAAPPPNAPAAIRTYVARLRRALGPAGPRLVSRPTGYAIEIYDPAEFDVAELEHLRVRSREAAEGGHWRQAASLCDKALSLWRGAPLEDIPSAALHGPDVERLTELRLEFTITRIDAELQLGRHHYLVADLRSLAFQYPLCEHIHAQLMLAYYRCGRQAEALAVYPDIRAMLAGEIGVEPGPELRKLHQLILSADPALHRPV